MNVIGVILLLIGLVILYVGFVYNRKKYEDMDIVPDADSLIGVIVIFLGAIILKLLPYKVTKTLLFILAFICFY
ncbi:hypothetical protein [Cytobacillus oceanisediminis]|uniref:hypothetical protein n=1 Tax=Cytobacillus oceanisediminis TaxID=665099 RepID=UPI001C23F04F|nr:hypothetical protein [Cytobacillus oceanisediminis]MBU8769570.1 hypothetical protein [Cytobacillus oceanisediminis]